MLDWAPISIESRMRLERSFEENDIKAALDHFEGEKAPGSRGTL